MEEVRRKTGSPYGNPYVDGILSDILLPTFRRAKMIWNTYVAVKVVTSA
jgi:hypothetical protein